jgi:hypothetical protein
VVDLLLEKADVEAEKVTASDLLNMQ